MFQVLKTDPNSAARLGRLTTPHGVVETPAFMPVGTQGTVKTLDPRELHEMGAQIILGNAYHLFLRPGLEVIRAAGGLHRFMSWPGPILTDSGGFQVFSLAKIRTIRDEGVEFQSHLDGARLFLGPKEAMSIQRELGSDIAMCFDDCPPHSAPVQEVRAAVERTIRWAATCRAQPRAPGAAVFGIVQGGTRAELREQCARALVAMGFDGYAIGGLSVGEPQRETLRTVELTVPLLPAELPRYAMGLGTPPQIVELVARGMDLFDCVLPTRVGRNGAAFTRRGVLNLKAARYKTDFGPIEPDCTCFACRHFSRAYLRHLLHAEEILALRMLTLHNCHMYLHLMADIRMHLAAGTFDRFRRQFAAQYVPSRRVLAQEQACGLGEGALDQSR
jgi:queuine tRNA-ribosyltransferase